MHRDVDRLLAPFADRNHGVFTSVHAREIGLSARQIKNRIETGQWRSLHDGTYRMAGSPLSWKGRLLAACWAGGFRAVASHRSAAALYEIAGGRREITELTCPRWRRARHDGLLVHETKALDARDIVTVDGIPVTSPERTIFDLGAVSGPVTVKMAFDKAWRLGLVTYSSTEQTLVRLARPGRPGSRKLRAVLQERNPAFAPPESEMETLMLDVIRRHGLPAPVPQYVIRASGRFIARVDAAYPELRIAIEYQSTQEHSGVDPLVRDSARRNRLYAIGWSVVDVTNPELKSGGDTFCAALRGQLRLASRRAL
jgi:hypothetical protein